MNKRLKSMFDLLLLLVNSVGIVGALLEAAGIRWSTLSGGRGSAWSGIPWASVKDNEVLEGAAFWGGLLLFCVLAALLWRGDGRRKTAFRGAVCGLLWLLAAFLCGRGLYGGAVLALQNSVEGLNEFYQVHIPWPDGVRLLEASAWPGGAGTAAATAGLLFFLFPIVTLSGLVWKHSRKVYLLAGNVLWFSAACIFDRFPGFLFLFLCALGLTASLVQKDFEGAPTAGFGPVMMVTAFSGLVMGLVYWFLLPVIDERYEDMEEERIQFYRVVNDQWLSGVKSTLSGYGILPGVDVTGTFNRSGVVSTAENYRVTVDRYPERALYLRGFVGGIYGENAWEAQTDRELEDYYREHGMELPEDFALFMNMSYEAAGAAGSGLTGYVALEELGGRGSYSLYPYGSLLTEEYRVHGDGSVERGGEGRSYGFAYRTLGGNGGEQVLTGEWADVEEKYRRYVYDTFLEYPGEKVPRLTAWLEQGDIASGSVGDTVLDLMELLGRQAVYNLDAERNPSGTDFVEHFLFESREGYCVHFASAAVLALRYFGIPARYVTGYAVSPFDFFVEENRGEEQSGVLRSQGGQLIDFSPAGQLSPANRTRYSAVLTGRQAHAWAEIYLDGLGWVPVEMTPGAAAFPEDNRMQQLEGFGFVREGLPEDEEKEEEEEERGPGAQTGREEPPEDEEEEEEPPQAQDVLLPEKEEAGGQGAGRGPGQQGMGAVWAAAFGVFALCLVLWLRRAVRRRWRAALRDGGTGERIFLLYGNLRKAVRIAGCPDWQAEGGDASWEEFRTVCPGLAQEEYQAFCTIMERSSFGEGEPSQAELKAVWELHDRAVGEVYAVSPFYKKMLFGVMGCHVDSRSGSRAGEGRC